MISNSTLLATHGMQAPRLALLLYAALILAAATLPRMNKTPRRLQGRRLRRPTWPR